MWCGVEYMEIVQPFTLKSAARLNGIIMTIVFFHCDFWSLLPTVLICCKANETIEWFDFSSCSLYIYFLIHSRTDGLEWVIMWVMLSFLIEFINLWCRLRVSRKLHVCRESGNTVEHTAYRFVQILWDLVIYCE